MKRLKHGRKIKYENTKGVITTHVPVLEKITIQFQHSDEVKSCVLRLFIHQILGLLLYTCINS